MISQIGTIARKQAAAAFAERPFLVFWEVTRACALACRRGSDLGLRGGLSQSGTVRLVSFDLQAIEPSAIRCGPVGRID